MENEEIKKTRKEAEKRLCGYMNKNQIGYEGYLTQEIIKILKEKGIDWKPYDGSITFD